MSTAETVARYVAICFLAAVCFAIVRYAPNATALVAVPLVAVVAGFMRPPTKPPGASGGAAALLVLLPFATLEPGCSAAQRQAILDASFSAAQIGCLFGSQVTDAKELAVLCKLATSPEVEALIRKLVAQRDAAKRAGVHWEPTAVDAGAQ